MKKQTAGLLLALIATSCQSSRSQEDPNNFEKAQIDSGVHEQNSIEPTKSHPFKRSLCANNDTIDMCLTLYCQETTSATEVPKELGFQITQKTKGTSNRSYSGSANLTSSVESITDPQDAEGGDYFAADYRFFSDSIEILVKVDIINFDIATLSIASRVNKEVYTDNNKRNAPVFVRAADCK